MYQTQFFSENELNPSRQQQQVIAPIQLPPADTVSIFNFDTPNGSPYSRRYPANQLNEKRR